MAAVNRRLTELCDVPTPSPPPLRPPAQCVLVAAPRQTGQHGRDHVVGQQVHRRERVVRLEMHLVLDPVLVRDGAHPGSAHREASPAEGHLAVLGPVPVGAAVLVVLPLRSGDVGDLDVDELAHHVEADRHRRRQQPLSHLRREHLELLAHPPGQALRQRRVGQVD